MLFDKISCQFYENAVDIKFVVYNRQSENINYTIKKYKKEELNT